MKYEGVLTKMQTEVGQPIQYYLVFPTDFLNVNQLLDKKVKIAFQGYQCLNCELNKKIYRQGYCYDCFFEIPLPLQPRQGCSFMTPSPWQTGQSLTTTDCPKKDWETC